MNAMSFLAPLLALAWLMIAGISLPRFDLFILGAALIIAINILIQLKPDQGRDFSRVSDDIRGRSQLSFTTFILSIWTFGSVVLLRDEIMPDIWLAWPGGDYWPLLALSATMFALILGFRIARISRRISHEDEMMFGLFRKCERLRKHEVLPEDMLEKLIELDTAPTRDLLQSYNSARRYIRSAIQSHGTAEHATSLESVAVQLDRFAHSKQQGRDIVELISLTAFAIVTVGLGLLARPSSLAGSHAAWSGFLSEVFLMLFVSTISFLCVNLFDIRLHRETPLLYSEQKLMGDYVLFFRYKQDLLVQHVASVLISVAMSVTFCVLLYHKWL